MHAPTTRRTLAATAATLTALSLAACGGGGDGGGGSGSGDSLLIGTSDKISTIDPAGAYDTGSFAVENQVYPFLVNTPPGSSDVEPDIAESAEFTSPTEYTVKLKSGLTFANGNALTSSDVVFSFRRIVTIADPNGPSTLLANMASVDATDDLTVVFTLKTPDDQTFPQVLTTAAGPVVDEQVFSATALTSDDDIVAGKPFAGPYTITGYEKNSLVSYTANPDYQGMLGAPKTQDVDVKYYSDSSNLKLDIEQGNIDVAFRSLTATDVDDLRGNDDVQVETGPGGEIRYVVFNFDTQPYGATTAEADAAKALAVRQAAADLIDREEIADQVYKGTYTPLYSYVPDGLTGATTPLKDLYGDGQGGPDADKAAQTLQAAGVQTPVRLSLQYSGDHYGPNSADEYALIKDQLESTGLFQVDLQTTEWTQYLKDRVADVYPAYQLGWFGDYPAADNYLTPLFGAGGVLGNHYSDQAVDALTAEQGTTSDESARTALTEQIQEQVAQQLPTIPYLQGAQVAVVRTGVEGAQSTLDASGKFRYGVISLP